MKGKDLINIGIFTAIYFVVTLVVAVLGFIPIFLPLLAVLVPILGGIPFMLFLTRVKTFGMIWIMSVIMGIMMLLTGRVLLWVRYCLVQDMDCCIFRLSKQGQQFRYRRL